MIQTYQKFRQNGSNIVTGLLASLASAGAGLASDAPQNWQLGFNEPASEKARQIYWFHDAILLPVIIAISVFVLILLIYVCVRFSEKNNPVPSKTVHHTWLEIIWTALPVLILGVMFIPSIKLLYMTEDNSKSELTIKVTGNQWYWNYEYPDNGNITFDSNYIPLADLPADQKNLFKLKVDKPLVVPVGKKVKLLVTANDVIHNFTLGAAGVKMDAVPGRINETSMTLDKPGTYYGFCQELCGTNHAYMPIEVTALSEEDFKTWLEKNKKTAQNNTINVAQK